MKETLPFVSIITVNYNGRKFLGDCFKSLFNLNYPQNKLEIFMVDNGSSDGSIAYVKKDFKKVKIIQNDINNYCRASNLGIKNSKGEFIALLNNDTKVDRNWLIELVKAAISDRSVACAGSKLLFMDGRTQSAGHSELPNFYWVDRQDNEGGHNQYRELEEVCSLCGGAVLYRKSALRETSDFDEDFNMYLEDVDMSLRLIKKYWKLIYVPKSIACHLKRGTASDDLALFYTERNRLFLLAKHYPHKLSEAILGRGYFTAQRDIKAQGDLYRILSEVILKLIKHHKKELVKEVLDELFKELGKISNYENIILVDKIKCLMASIDSQQEVITEKDKHIGNLNLEVVRRDQEIKNKSEHITNLNLEIDKRSQALEEKDNQINSLNLELGMKEEALQQKEIQINSLNLELGRKEEELTNLYNSTAFKFIVRPLWFVLLRVKKLFLKTNPALSLKRNLISDGGKIDTNRIAICTIISKNYLAYARVLTESFLQYNQAEVFVLLVDKIDGYFDPMKEKFTTIEIDTIKERIPNFEQFCFQYNITELNTAVKPYFLEFLFEKFKLGKVIFFDPDILINGNLNYLFDLLNKFSIVIIPHITQPFKDNHKPLECDILKSGVYNLGFIGLSNKDSTLLLLKWWKERLLRYCKIDFQNGLFVDQKWIDLLPGFFEDAFILRDSTYNIAYWNMHYRKAYLDKNTILVNGEPAHFLHFSGFNPDIPESISKHQDRFKLSDLKHMKPIFNLYRNKLVANGYKVHKNWPCIFEHFDNGAKIPDIVRKIYSEIKDAKNSSFNNPFNTLEKNSYFNWLNEKMDNKIPKISRFMHEIYKKRTDVQFVYPDIFGNDRARFLIWFSNSISQEYDLDSSFLCRIYLFNTKDAKRFVMGLKAKAFYKIRGLLKAFLKKITGNNLWMINNLRTVELRGYRKIAQINMLLGKKKKHVIRRKDKKIGINVMGYLNSELGVGEGSRLNVKSLKAAGINFSLINIDNHSISRKCDFSFSGFSTDNPYDINLIYVNADLFPKLYVEKGTSFFRNKYNIGFWTWELSDFPDEWLDSFNYCDEVWVPSSFVLNSIAKKSPIRVTKIPYAIGIDNIKNIDRSFFGLKEEEFLFLFIFDFFSFFERKNPLSLIQAFKKAFSGSQNAKLLIKCTNSSYDPAAFKKMKKETEGLNVQFIDNYLYRDEVNALISLCDCYVSLHRSEGFGLTIAEAMFLGKPVIATAYSGNMDFMNINNSYLVKYKLTEVNNDSGPYKKGNLWAEPDVNHAADLMHYVYKDYESAKKVGKQAAEDIRKNFNFKVIGDGIKKRIDYLYNSNSICL